MKINQHLIRIARNSSRGIFLTDRCSGAFLIHVVRAVLLAVIPTATPRFREPNKWTASRPISLGLLKVFSCSEMTKSPLMKGLLLLALFLIPVDLFAWTNGELLIWMDADRGQALKAIAAKKFENDFGLKVTIEDPEKITDSFPIAAQMAKGPDIVIWAHDKIGEWADAGLIAPVQISEEFGNRFSRRPGKLYSTMGVSDRSGNCNSDL